jgi:polyisoprenoid-binding protein YceI
MFYVKNKISKSTLMKKRISDFKTSKISVTLTVLMMFALNLTFGASEYSVDKAASKVKWEAKKVTGQHHGSISFANGSVVVKNNKISGGTFSIDMKSIADEDLTNDNMNKKLIGHLSSDDFFSVEKFPESKMVIKKVTDESGNEFHFLADLTIKGITNPVEFKAKVSIDGDKLTAEGIITVNRTLYGIKYGSGSFFEGLGDKMIYDDFTLAFNITALKK